MNKLIIILTGIVFILNCGRAQTKEMLLPKNTKVDKLVVYKSERKLHLYSNNKEIAVWDIALGHTPVGKKEIEGDGKTPEGLYYIDQKSAVSKYHKNLNISYPNEADRTHAASLGKSAGGDIKIHGLPATMDDNRYKRSDWTLGCIALTNAQIDALFDAIVLGSPIQIYP